MGTMEFCFSSQGEDARLVLRCKMNQLPDQVPNWESQVSLQTAEFKKTSRKFEGGSSMYIDQFIHSIGTCFSLVPKSYTNKSS